MIIVKVVKETQQVCRNRHTKTDYNEIARIHSEQKLEKNSFELISNVAVILSNSINDKIKKIQYGKKTIISID